MKLKRTSHEKDPKSATLLAARLARAYPSLSAYSAAIDHDAQHICCTSCGYIYAEFY